MTCVKGFSLVSNFVCPRGIAAMPRCSAKAWLTSFATIKYQQMSATMHKICPVKKPSSPGASDFRYRLMFLGSSISSSSSHDFRA